MSQYGQLGALQNAEGKGKGRGADVGVLEGTREVWGRPLWKTERTSVVNQLSSTVRGNPWCRRRM